MFYVSRRYEKLAYEAVLENISWNKPNFKKPQIDDVSNMHVIIDSRQIENSYKMMRFSMFCRSTPLAPPWHLQVVILTNEVAQTKEMVDPTLMIAQFLS